MTSKQFLMSVLVAGSIFTAACAPSPDKVTASSTSTALYENLTCKQLVSEAHNVSNKAHEAVGLQKRHRKQDAAIVAAGALVFWPAIFFTHRGDVNTAELASLKGQMVAIESASQNKNCGIEFDHG